ncbi:NAD(P)-dependent oxidoreductase [Flavobacterium agrisoli]|uniref:Saccharopine dehydrogenase [NAD(+), L-lysine-forming] n=1 Tax=Flavobacterium agrisoli TaxID=2793066 RepID=A0A934PP58_9FLAO|nr:NAD(P)-dependent oxidoreductase [Flavobacterium agrisoli]MBK0370071.1 alanine dehydrogenase [Flavobacterium agrisoli]
MKFGICRERKNPPDKRVVLPPNAAKKIIEMYPNVEIVVEHSDERAFSDAEYESISIPVVENLQNCDVIFGVKEIPVDYLLPNTAYFLFSHTIKKQLHNRDLLRAILTKKCTLYDYETVVDAQNKRLIGFGYYAGLVGAYNAIRAFGIKFELFKLPKAETLNSKDNVISALKRITLPPIKIVITGKGRVGSGVQELLKAIKVKEVTPENFLTKKYAQPVFVQLSSSDYNTIKENQNSEETTFHNHPEAYESAFESYTKVSDIYITAHFHHPKAPKILTQEMLKSNDCNIRVIADISCDLKGSLESTLRISTIKEPYYGYLPATNSEVDIFHPAAIVVMAVDNLPCSLPVDASNGFAEQILEHVFPAFFNNDKDGILERAKIAENGKLTPRFAYLQDYVE